MVWSKNTRVYNTLFTAFVRSLLIYHFTPLVSAGFMCLEEVHNYEVFLLRKVLGLPHDVKSTIIRNVYDNYKRDTKEIIGNLS